MKPCLLRVALNCSSSQVLHEVFYRLEGAWDIRAIDLIEWAVRPVDVLAGADTGVSERGEGADLHPSNEPGKRRLSVKERKLLKKVCQDCKVECSP